MIGVKDENGHIVGKVEISTNLDQWDGHNWSDNRKHTTGEHAGITMLQDGRFVLILTSQWEGEHPDARVISIHEAYDAIMTRGHADIVKNFPSLLNYEFEHISPEFKGMTCHFSGIIKKDGSYSKKVRIPADMKHVKIGDRVNVFMIMFGPG